MKAAFRCWYFVLSPGKNRNPSILFIGVSLVLLPWHVSLIMWGLSSVSLHANLTRILLKSRRGLEVEGKSGMVGCAFGEVQKCKSGGVLEKCNGGFSSFRRVPESS